MTRDFTLAAYDGILEAIKASGLPVFTVRQWQNVRPTEGVLMRHDVDRRHRNALAMARLEHRHQVRSTYYFRMTRGSFDAATIDAIHRMGHEVGYHYEDLSETNGDIAAAVRSFEHNLSRLRALAPVDTAAPHGRPFSRFDNRTLWKAVERANLGVVADAFGSVDYRGTYYFTDTGRSWGTDSANLRDHVAFAETAPAVRTTDDLVAFVRAGVSRKMAIVCHPERWDAHPLSWTLQALKDGSINFAKRCIVRKPSASVQAIG